MKLLLIYNPNAGGKRAAKILPGVKSYFAEKNIDVEILLTEYSWHGIELLKNTDLRTLAMSGGRIRQWPIWKDRTNK